MSRENIILNKLLSQVTFQKASELHLSVGEYPVLRVSNDLIPISAEEIVTNEFMNDIVTHILDEPQVEKLSQKRSLSTVYNLDAKLRFKINFFYQKSSLAASFRPISNELVGFKELGLPKTIEKLANIERGLIILAGPFDSGKTSTAAAFIEHINKNKAKRILTLEQPIEYVFSNDRSFIEQREVGLDTPSYADGLKDSLSEDVDVVAVSELTDLESLTYILELAESGRLVILQMESESSLRVIEQIIEYFHDDERTSIKSRLAGTLAGIVVQRLIPRIGGGRVSALEIVLVNNAVKAMLKEDRLSQLDNLITISRGEGMITLDTSLAELVKTNEILMEDAVKCATSPDKLKNMLNL